MVTTVPPPVLPLLGLTAVTVGAGAAVYVKWSALVDADMPVKVVTVTSTVPAASAGAVAVIDVSEFTVKLAPTPPKETACAPVKLVPVIVTDVPPAVLPVFGDTAVTAGVGAAV
jgi:hypothetical protein